MVAVTPAATVPAVAMDVVYTAQVAAAVPPTASTDPIAPPEAAVSALNLGKKLGSTSGHAGAQHSVTSNEHADARRHGAADVTDSGVASKS